MLNVNVTVPQRGKEEHMHSSTPVSEQICVLEAADTAEVGMIYAEVAKILQSYYLSNDFEFECHPFE